MARTTLGAFLKLIPTFADATVGADWLRAWPSLATPEGWAVVLDRFGCPQALVNGWEIYALLQANPELQPLQLSCESFQAKSLPFVSARIDFLLQDWIQACLSRGSGFSTAVILVSLDGQYLGLLDLATALTYWGQQLQPDTKHLGLEPNLLAAWEQLPWPVLLQTGEGEAVWQNRAWQDKIGNTPHRFPQSPPTAPTPTDSPLSLGNWQFYSLPLSTDRGILESTLLLRTQPELLPALCLVGLGAMGTPTLNPDPPVTVTLWLVLALEFGEIHAHQRGLEANLTALRQRYQGQQEFLASLNHELKNPVTSLLGLTQLLNQPSTAATSPSHGEYLAHLEQSSRQLGYLLNQWLDLTQAEQGNLDLTWEPIRIRQLLAQAQEWLSQRPDVFPKGLSPTGLRQRWRELMVDLSPGLEVISGDRLRLQHSLGHILTALIWLWQNSDSIPPGDWGLTAKQWPGWYELRVWQGGTGIPEVVQSQCLFRLGDGGQWSAGVGLGLILARQLVRLHGGELSLWATPPGPDAFVEFSLLFPLKFEHQGQMVLVYGQTGAWLRQLSTYLQGCGYGTVMARQDLELLDKSRQLLPVAIVIEPEIAGGLELGLASLQHLLSGTPETAQIPLISWGNTADFGSTSPGTYLLKQNFDNSEGVPDKALEPLGQLLQTLPEQAQARARLSASLLNPEPPPTDTPVVLTVLRLGSTHGFTPQLHRFLEADDLEQGQLLAKIWQPDILLWDLPLPMGLNELASLSHYPELVALPLVTLDEQITRRAHQIPGVAVYPCLDAALLGQVIERAWRHSTT